MKNYSNIKIDKIQRWIDGMFLVCINQKETTKINPETGVEEPEFSADMVISESDKEEDIQIAIDKFNEDNNCFDKLIFNLE